MRKFFRKISEWSHDRPFTTAVIVFLVIVTPGFVRIEQVTNKTNSTAARVSTNEVEENLLSCQTRNTFQKNTREKFKSFIDAVEVAFVSQADSPQRAEAIRLFTDQLRASVSTDPKVEDRDCNEDGKFDTVDYLPA